MPVDASIYNAFIRPVRSVAEYEQDALAVEGGRQQNALRALTLRQGQRAQADADRALGEQDGVRNALAGLGDATPDVRVNALRRLGTQSALTQADSLEKGHLDRQKTDAEIDSKRAGTAKTEFDTRKARLDFALQGLATAGNADDAKAHLVRGVRRGDIGMQEAQQMAAAVPADAAAFDGWRRSMLMSTLDAKQQMGFTTPDANAVLNASTSSANNAASNARQAAEGAAGRAVQRRGQDMTDARSRELAGAARENAAALREEKVTERKASADDKAAERKTQGQDKAVAKFSTELQKEGIPDIEAALAGAEAVFAKYTSKDGKLGDVPGIGRAANALPDALVFGDEGTDVRQSLSAVSNLVLSARSGAAVTDQELRRLARELSIGVGKSPEQTKAAYAKFRARFELVKANLSAGVSDDVKGEYEARGGIHIQRGGAKPAQGEAYADAEKERRYQEWKRTRGAGK